MFLLTVCLLLTSFILEQSLETDSQNVIYSKTSFDPYDLEDEIRAQVDELRATVRGHIYDAFNAVDNAVREVFWHRDDVLNTARIAIQEEYESLNTALTQLKDVAQGADQSVDVCLGEDEPIFNELPQKIIDSLMECLAVANSEVTIINNNARYYIDIYINEVNFLDYEVDLCAKDLLCMSPLVTRIELAKVEIPQNIGVEVELAKRLCEDLKVLIEDCTKSRIAQYASEGGNMLNKMATCIDNLLS